MATFISHQHLAHVSGTTTSPTSDRITRKVSSINPGKACKALNDQAIATAGLDAAREELSDLAIKVANECPPSVTPTSSLTHISTHIENEHAPNVDSCLSSHADVAKKRQRAMFMQSEWRGV